MLTSRQVARIRRLAKQGHSRGGIQRITRHGSTTISRVLRGTHPVELKIAGRTSRSRRAKKLQAELEQNYLRCRGCGRLVQLPCLACKIDELKFVQRCLKAA